MLSTLQSSAVAAVALLATFATFQTVPSAECASAAPLMQPIPKDCDIDGPTPICEATPSQYSSAFAGSNYVWSFPAGTNTAGAFLCGPNGQQSVCVNTTQAGSFTLQLDYVLQSGPKTCTLVVTVDASTSITNLTSQQACPGDNVVFSTSVVAGAGPHTFAWTVNTGSGPVPIPGATTGTLQITNFQASDVGVYCVNVTGLCGSDQSCAELGLGKCGPGGGTEFCTLTQGAYGSAGGAGNLTQINLLIGRGLTVGKPGRSVTFLAGSGQCIIDRLPAGSTPASMPAVGDATINTGSCQTAPTPLPLKNGRFKNVLLGQTITLALNTRLDTNLSGLALCETIVTQGGGGGQHTLHISSNVFDALATLGLPFTVGGILELANRALAAQPTGGATLSEINDAAASINEAFDGCRTIVDCF